MATGYLPQHLQRSSPLSPSKSARPESRAMCRHRDPEAHSHVECISVLTDQTGLLKIQPGHSFAMKIPVLLDGDRERDRNGPLPTPRIKSHGQCCSPIGMPTHPRCEGIPRHWPTENPVHPSTRSCTARSTRERFKVGARPHPQIPARDKWPTTRRPIPYPEPDSRVPRSPPTRTAAIPVGIGHRR